MLEYKINEQEEPGFISYGVDAFDGGVRVKSVRSVSDSRDKIEELILALNLLDARLCHIDCIIEDFLTDFSL